MTKLGFSTVTGVDLKFTFIFLKRYFDQGGDCSHCENCNREWIQERNYIDGLYNSLINHCN